MTLVVAPADALYTMDRRPPESSRAVSPLALVSPAGKFRVEVVGLAVAVGVTDRYPARVWPVTVTAPAGMPFRPVMVSVRGVLARKTPDSPVPPGRLSRTRTGVIGR